MVLFSSVLQTETQTPKNNETVVKLKLIFVTAATTTTETTITKLQDPMQVAEMLLYLRHRMMVVLLTYDNTRSAVSVVK